MYPSAVLTVSSSVERLPQTTSVLRILARNQNMNLTKMSILKQQLYGSSVILNGV